MPNTRKHIWCKAPCAKENQPDVKPEFDQIARNGLPWGWQRLAWRKGVVLQATRSPFRQTRCLSELLSGSVCENSEARAPNPARPGSSPDIIRADLTPTTLPADGGGTTQAGPGWGSALPSGWLPEFAQQLRSPRSRSSTRARPHDPPWGLRGAPAVSAAGSAPVPARPLSSGPRGGAAPSFPLPGLGGLRRAPRDGDEGSRRLPPASLCLLQGWRKWRCPPRRCPPPLTPARLAASRRRPPPAHPSGDGAKPRRSIKSPPGAGGKEGRDGGRDRERERGYRAGGAAGEGEGRGAGSGTMAQSVWGYDSDNGEWGCGAAGRAGSEPGWHFLAFPPPPQDPSTGMKTTPWPRETSSRPLRSTPKTCSTTILSALGTPVTIPGQRKPSWTTGAPAESSSTTCSIDQVGFWFGFRGLLGIKVCKALGIKCILWYPAYGGWQRKVIWVHKKRAPSGGSGGSGHV